MADKHDLEQRNFLLGRGERLTQRITPKKRPFEPVFPYSFEEAQQRLLDQTKHLVEELDAIPKIACPNDEIVAALTMHPKLIARSYFPSNFLKEVRLRNVGSRSKNVVPDNTKKTNPDRQSPTYEIFIAGKKSQFRNMIPWLSKISGTRDKKIVDNIRSVENLRFYGPHEKLINMTSSGIRTPLMEIVLHASFTDGYILTGFKNYLDQLKVEVDLDKRIHSKGLCFLPVHIPVKTHEEVAKFSFLRIAREMPRLRELHLPSSGHSPTKSFHYTLPSMGPMDPNLRAAVFDGGVPSNPDLRKWVEERKLDGLGNADPKSFDHGLSVTSALLFGPIKEGVTLEQPFSYVDHYRVFDEDSDMQEDSYSTLEKILNILNDKKYMFVNLSIGPEMAIDDNDIDAWTAKLDEHFSNGETLATIAAGNGGLLDDLSGNNRVQIPADCVNGMTVGACDKQLGPWKRAEYSSVGPGRSPGLIKPDVVAFGGSSGDPYWVIGPRKATPKTGTSFAAPTVLRMALGIRSYIGSDLSPLAIKALLIHRANDLGHNRTEVGWGRIPDSLEKTITCASGTVTIVYQGNLEPAKLLQAKIPLPVKSVEGIVGITATFCFSSDVDPQDTPSYTRSGLVVTFRPHNKKSNTATFFKKADFNQTENLLRSDAQKWETVLHNKKRMQGNSLQDPVFEIHYVAREEGHDANSAQPIPYALIVTIATPKEPQIYNLVLNRYRSQLEMMKPVIELPIRVR